jgi:hypothetical protein
MLYSQSQIAKDTPLPPNDLNSSAVVIYPDQDSCYGTVYRQSGCGEMDNLSFGGWGDYYYNYFQFETEEMLQFSNFEKAELWFWASAPNNPHMKIDRVTQSWSEQRLSVFNNPASVSFGSAPPVPVRPGWVKIDITLLVRAWNNKQFPNYGVKLSPERNDQTNGSMPSSENENLAVRPRLVIYGGT